VDLFWRAECLVVEFDSFRFHSSRRAFETDRRRDQRLAAAGYVVLRVTWLQLTREPEAVVSRIARALGRRSRRALAR
jgi:very-short-patch-repair endonuclease